MFLLLFQFPTIFTSRVRNLEFLFYFSLICFIGTFNTVGSLVNLVIYQYLCVCEERLHDDICNAFTLSSKLYVNSFVRFIWLL